MAVADQQYPSLTKPGFAVLACNSALATYNSVALVLAAGAAAVVLLFLCLRKHERARGEDGMAMHGPHAALAKVGFAVVTCITALDNYGARRGPGSAAFLLVAYAALVILTGLFVRAFAVAHAHGGEQWQD